MWMKYGPFLLLISRLYAGEHDLPMEWLLLKLHTVDTEFSVTNFFCLHFSEHAQWGLPVMSDILVKIFVDISCNICGLFLL